VGRVVDRAVAGQHLVEQLQVRQPRAPTLLVGRRRQHDATPALALARIHATSSSWYGMPATSSSTRERDLALHPCALPRGQPQRQAEQRGADRRAAA
jgi:hypothetical protein